MLRNIFSRQQGAREATFLLHCQVETLGTPHNSEGKGYVQDQVPEKMTIPVFSLTPGTLNPVLFLEHVLFKNMHMCSHKMYNP